MTFQETFTDLRARRRIPMRLFREKAGISPSYIHSIEQEGFLPSEEKLKLLAEVFVEVATEQDARDPDSDARALFHARRLAELTGLGFDPELAELLLFASAMKGPERAALMPALWDALAIYTTIDDQERGGIADLIARIRALVDSHDVNTRGFLASELARRIGVDMDELEESPEWSRAPARDLHASA